jgi:hypothetical protein
MTGFVHDYGEYTNLYIRRYSNIFAIPRDTAGLISSTFIVLNEVLHRLVAQTHIVKDVIEEILRARTGARSPSPVYW